MANFYIGIGFNSEKEKENTLIKTANNETKEIIIKGKDIKACNRDDLILMIMAEVKEKLEKVIQEPELSI